MEYRGHSGRKQRIYDLSVTGDDETQNIAQSTFHGLLDDIVPGWSFVLSAFNPKARCYTFRNDSCKYFNDNSQDPASGIKLGVLHVALLSEMSKIGWIFVSYSRNPIDELYGTPPSMRPSYREREWTFKKEIIIERPTLSITS